MLRFRTHSLIRINRMGTFVGRMLQEDNRGHLIVPYALESFTCTRQFWLTSIISQGKREALWGLGVLYTYPEGEARWGLMFVKSVLVGLFINTITVPQSHRELDVTAPTTNEGVRISGGMIS